MPERPGSLRALVQLLRPASTAPSFGTFSRLVYDFISQMGERTVTGMWQTAPFLDMLVRCRREIIREQCRQGPPEDLAA